MLDLSFHARFASSPKRMSADELKILGNFVHLGSFEIRDYNVYVVSAMIMHPAK